MAELTPDLQQKAFEEFGETIELRSEKLKELRTKIQALPDEDTQIQDLSDDNLIRFLRGRKYDIEKALQTTIKLRQFHNSHPDWVSNLNAKEFEEFDGFFQVLEYPDPQGRLIVVLCPKLGLPILTPEYLQQHSLAVIRSNIWFLDKISRDPYAQVNGVVIFNMFTGLTVWDQLTLGRIVRVREQLALFHFIQECVGMRLKAVVVIDAPYIIRWLLGLIRPMLSVKVKERFFFCTSERNTIEEFVGDASKIPVRFGGDLDDDGGYSWMKIQIQQEGGGQGGQEESSK